MYTRSECSERSLQCESTYVPAGLWQCRKPRSIVVHLLSCPCCCAHAVAVARLCGYLTFGTACEGNVLKNFATGKDAVMGAVTICLLLVGVFSVRDPPSKAMFCFDVQHVSLRTSRWCLMWVRVGALLRVR